MKSKQRITLYQYRCAQGMCSVELYFIIVTTCNMLSIYAQTHMYRELLYLKGGVLFVTSRILVVDLLKQQCPTESVSGILVFNAHRFEVLCSILV